MTVTALSIICYFRLQEFVTSLLQDDGVIGVCLYSFCRDALWWAPEWKMLAITGQAEDLPLQ